jgi:SAM-dependent methyltransferase
VRWGGSEAQWWGSIFPRLQAYLPAARVLEIGCGYGRLSRLLANFSRELLLVENTERCVAACRARFRGQRGVRVHETDGRSLPMARDRSIDFVVSLDSLVHAEEDVLRDYVREIARVLTPTGAAFLHHSNVAALRDPWGGLPFPNKHWRGVTASAAGVRASALEHVLVFIAKEILGWGEEALTAFFSVLVRGGSPWAREPRIVENHDFEREVGWVAANAELYRVEPSRWASRDGGLAIARKPGLIGWRRR